MSKELNKTRVTILPESQQLNQMNWIERNNRIQIILMSQGLISHIDGMELALTILGTTITIKATAARDAWSKEDMIMKATIMLNMTDLMGCGIDLIPTTVR